MSAKARELLLAARLKKAGTEQQKIQPSLIVTKTETNNEPVKLEEKIVKSSSLITDKIENELQNKQEDKLINFKQEKTVNTVTEEAKSINKDNKINIEANISNINHKEKNITVNKKKGSILDSNPKFAIFNQAPVMQQKPIISIKPKDLSKEIKVGNNLQSGICLSTEINKNNNSAVNSPDKKQPILIKPVIKETPTIILNKEQTKVESPIKDNVLLTVTEDKKELEKDKKDAEKVKKMTKISTAKNLINNNKVAKEQQDLKSRQSMRIMDIAKNLNNVIGSRPSFMQPMMSMPVNIIKEENKKDIVIEEIKDENGNIIQNKENEIAFKSEIDSELYTKGDLFDILKTKPVKEVRKKAKNSFNV